MPVTVTIEDERSERGPAVFAVPDGCRVVVRRCSDGADVLVLPDADTALPSKSIAPAGEPHGVSTWGVFLREDDRSFLLRLQDRHGRDHEFIVSAVDLLGIGTSARIMTDGETQPAAAAEPDPDAAHLTAPARKANAEAERVELEYAAARRALSLCDDSPLAGYSVSVDHEPRGPGERVLRISFDDGAGRTAVIALPFALALKLNGSIGRAVAERLDAAGGL